MTALRFAGVTVDGHSGPRLDDVSFAVESGDFVLLVGPNGAGKTTALRAALGLVRPSRGQVLLGGRDPAAMTSRERAALVAWLPQQGFARLESLVVRDLVAAARFRFGEGRRRALGAADAALERVGAAALGERDVRNLSGGERQRVAIAALLAQEAPLLVLDEPATHLDPVRQAELYGLLRDLWHAGLGIVCVTHDLNLLASIGRPDRVRVVGLAVGRVVLDLVHSDPDLPAALGALFDGRLDAVEFDGRRLFVASPAREG